MNKEEIMKPNIRGGIFHLTKYVLFFSIILLLSCISTSAIRLEGDDFKKNLPGLWEGRWYWNGRPGPLVPQESGNEYIKITGIDGNKVHLTGHMETHHHGQHDEVNGRVENSTLFVTWPTIEAEEVYQMKKDDSNNLMLDGYWRGSGAIGKVQLMKIE